MLTIISLADQIRAIRAESDLVGPSQIGDKLRAAYTDEEKARLFDDNVELLVSLHLTRERMTYTPSAPTARVKGASAQARPTRTRPQQVAEWWQVELRTQYLGADGWKMLRDFTVADFVFAAKARKARAARLLVASEWHERCAEAMAQAKVHRFEELGAGVADLLSARERAS